ncbi:thiamine pyrophosphate-dependent enzyme, partial [Rhizobiaceae sp. 2RAB30]
EGGGLEKATGALTAQSLAMTAAARLPEGAVVTDEAITMAGACRTMTARAAPHSWLQLTGGAIGIGLPLATGAAVAAPDRKVLAFQADGSAAYTLQALWTQARENLDVVTIILANRTYAILRYEMSNLGIGNPGPKAVSMTRLDKPALDWVRLAEGMGVEAARATTAEELDDLLASAMKRRGPFLIEAVLG